MIVILYIILYYTIHRHKKPTFFARIIYFIRFSFILGEKKVQHLNIYIFIFRSIVQINYHIGSLEVTAFDPSDTTNLLHKKKTIVKMWYSQYRITLKAKYGK